MQLISPTALAKARPLQREWSIHVFTKQTPDLQVVLLGRKATLAQLSVGFHCCFSIEISHTSSNYSDHSVSF